MRLVHSSIPLSINQLQDLNDDPPSAVAASCNDPLPLVDRPVRYGQDECPGATRHSVAIDALAAGCWRVTIANELMLRHEDRSQSFDSLPKITPWFQSGFHRFLTKYLASHFHAVAVQRRDRESRDELRLADLDGPVIVYGNHPSWWDPLVAHFLNRRLFPGRQFYAPIDAEALESYKVFRKLGFYGVNSSRIGAIDFLRLSHQILELPNIALWLTPEGRFTDVRDHEVKLMSGLSHLCHRREQGYVIALSIEYAFWDERLPVCLARFGDPLRLGDHLDWSREDWHTRLTSTLRQNQADLSQAVIARDSSVFDNLIKGKSGAGSFYDSFRRARSWISRKPFVPQHSKQFH